MVAKSIRKNVVFDESDDDRVLLDAIATEQSKQQQSFSDLCKQALHHYLHHREPLKESLVLELQQQIIQLGVRVAALEAGTRPIATEPLANRNEVETIDEAVVNEDTTDNIPTADPVLDRLGPLLDNF